VSKFKEWTIDELWVWPYTSHQLKQTRTTEPNLNKSFCCIVTKKTEDVVLNGKSLVNLPKYSSEYNPHP
jgi:hypothetical protein